MPAQTYDLIDKAIAIAIVLFVLSMIAERFVTWTKLTFGVEGKKLFFFSTKEENIAIKSSDPVIEKKREKKIIGLNIVLSTLIAFAAHANLFNIIGSDLDPYRSIGWNNFSFKEFCKLGEEIKAGKIIFGITGTLLSGLFISLGSKFWHDFLDLLFYTKNLKEKLSDPKSYEVTSVDQLEEYLKFTENDLTNLALAQNELVLKTKFTNIHYLINSVALINGERKSVLGIFLFDNNTANIPSTIPVKLPSGKTYPVQTQIISGLGKVKIQGGLDGSVAHEDSSHSTGSACCVVIDEEDQNYLLTNCHVLTEGQLSNPGFNTDGKQVLYNNEEIGKWYYGSITPQGDFALAAIENDATEIDTELFNNQTRAIEAEDYHKLNVTVRGNKSRTTTGAYILGISINQVRVEYKYASIIVFNEAILIGDRSDIQNCKPVTQEGDSGGAVYDKENKLIGIITAKDEKFTYAIPIQAFLNNLKLRIK